ncbi:MAG TPA: type I restriction enzyme HsdR N-terminal domain-containing protein [Bacteroidales bacterium]|nr:type I restriction enzyme HsdR N-terminal domain-containing protein [Bacteroidales bacterium]
MQQLNLPAIDDCRLRHRNERTEIFDSFRRKYVVCSPEEWVRQHFAHYLVNYLMFPASLTTIEKPIIVNRKRKRCDIVVHNREGHPLMIVECKSPEVKISEETLHQAMIYDLALHTRFVILTNGLVHFCFESDKETKQIRVVDKIPTFKEIDNIQQGYANRS